MFDNDLFQVHKDKMMTYSAFVARMRALLAMAWELDCAERGKVPDSEGTVEMAIAEATALGEMPKLAADIMGNLDEDDEGDEAAVEQGLPVERHQDGADCEVEVCFWVSQRAALEEENLHSHVSHRGKAGKLACGRSTTTYIPLGEKWPEPWPFCKDCAKARPEIIQQGA